MNRKHWLQPAAILTLALSGVSTNAQSAGLPVVPAGVHPPFSAASVVSSTPAIVFEAVPLGAAPSQLTAIFSIAGALGVPTASLHYGHDYSLGQISCADLTCSVTVSFSPTLPGTRPDAIFVTDGAQRIATIPVSGTGQSPFALLRPASLVSASSSSIPAVLDDNGTLYSLDATGQTVTATDVSGKAAILPIANLTSARGIAIDGAGVLYLLPSTPDQALIAYDTVQGIQSSFALPAPATTIDSIAIGPAGDLFAVSTSAHLLYKVGQGGVVGKTSLPVTSEAGPAAAAQSLAGGTQLAALAIASERTQPALDFGSVAPSANAGSQLALLSNAGNQPLTVSDIRVAGDGFSLVSAPDAGCGGGVVVAPGASCQIAVALLAPKSGAVSGTLTVAANSLNQPSSLLKLPVVAHTAGSQAILTPNALIFPNTTVNVASAAQIITLSNPGTAALNISSVALTGAASGSYSLTTTCISATVTSLAAGGSCTISVVFKPLTAVSQSAVVSVGDDVNGVVGSSQTATLIGLGVAAPAPVISFSAVSANGLSNSTTSATTSALGTLSFGNAGTNPVLVVPAGTPTPPTGTVTITNTGNAVLNLSPITLILSGSSTVLPYTQTNNCPSTLAVGASCLVTVQFVPPANTPTTTYTAVLVLVDNAAGSPQTFGISGIATTTDFNITASTANLTIPSSGGSGQVVITSTPDPGPFFTPVSLSVFGMPAAATYSFSPIAITSVTAPGTSTLTITLPTYKNIVLSSLDGPSMLRRTSLPAAAFLLAGLCVGLRRKRMPRLTRPLQILLVGLLGVAATAMSSCSSGVPISGGVAPGTYYLTITGSSANGYISASLASHQTSVKLVVQ